MEPRGSIPHSQEPAKTGTCPEANGIKVKKVRFEVLSAVTMKKTM
jgi:hypothetical protein